MLIGSSACLALGVLLIFLSLTSRRREPAAAAPGAPSVAATSEGAPAPSERLLPLLPAVIVGVATAAVTQWWFGWPVLSLAAGGVSAVIPSWYQRHRESRVRDLVDDAVAEAVDSLRDAARVGIGMEAALRALGQTGPEPLRPVFRAFDADARLVGFEDALIRARGRVAHPAFDTLVVALLMSYRVGGRNLSGVLDGLSRSVRGAARARREVRAAQAEHVLSARVIAVLPLVLIVAIRATNPGYLDVFSTPTGQAVLALCLVSVAVGYAGMLRATALPGGERVLR
ncbi:MAG: hypothetical protein AMXMBFR23_02880 [Chloroflexota bacterium]